MGFSWISEFPNSNMMVGYEHIGDNMSKSVPFYLEFEAVDKKMVKATAMKDVEAEWRLEAFKDISRAQMEVNAMKANILDSMGMSLQKSKTTWNDMLKTYNTVGNDEYTKLAVSEEERIAKAYRDVCKEKEVYALNEELLQQMDFNETEEKELIHTAEDMKNLMGGYNDICKLLNWRFVEEMSKVSTMEDIELLLQSARFWLASGSLRLAISLGNLSVRIDQRRGCHRVS